MNRSLALFSAFLFSSFLSTAQTAPSTQWSKTFGGNKEDHVRSIIQTKDRGYLMTGYSNSSKGQVTGAVDTFAMFIFDDWIVKTDSAGNLTWSTTIAGAGDQQIRAACETKDHYVICGFSFNRNGIFAKFPNAPATFGYVAWLDKMTGQLKNIRAYHTSSGGELFGIEPLPNGNVAVTGCMFVPGKAREIWIAELDGNGDIQWEKYFGGTDDDRAWGFTRKKDKGYLISAWIASPSVPGAKGGADAYLINLDSAGNTIWTKVVGGPNNEILTSVRETPSGDFICGGYAGMQGGDVPATYGKNDFWAIKIDKQGNIKWSKTYGGSEEERFENVTTTEDEGAVLFGKTASTDHDVKDNNGFEDAWVVRIDSAGSIVWDKTFGSSAVDNAGTLTTTCDNGYIFNATATVHDLDVAGTQWGSFDMWVVKLSPDGMKNKTCIPETVTSANDLMAKSGVRIYPNPAHDQLTIMGADAGTSVIVFDMVGRQVYKGEINTDKAVLDVSAWPAGNYHVQLCAADGVASHHKVVKQ